MSGASTQNTQSTNATQPSSPTQPTEVQQGTGAHPAADQGAVDQGAVDQTQQQAVESDGTVGSEETDASAQVRTELQSWMEGLASDSWAFHRAMQRASGDSYDRGHFERLRREFATGEASVPEIRFGDPESATEETIVLPAALLEQPREAGLAAASALAQRFAPEGGSINAEQFALEINPAEHGELRMYLDQPPANEEAVPPLFASAGLAYGSTPVNSAPVSHEGVTHDWNAGWIGTPQDVFDMDEGGIGNMMNPEWRAAVAKATELNGGLGNSEDGFLAWSRQYGFHRLRNPRFSPEQNRRMAEMSLTLGVPAETIPSRTEDSALLDPGIDKWVNEIIGRYDKEMADFVADPTNGISVNDGRKRYKLEFNEEAGRFVSYDYKKSGGIKGWVQKNMKYIGPVLDVVGVAVNIIPGIGQAASAAIAAGSQILKTASQVIATGKLKAQQVAGVIGSFLPGIGKFFDLTKTQTALVGGVTNATAQYIDTGKFDVSALVSAAAPSIIQGLPGGPAMDRAVQATTIMAAKAIEDGRLDARDALSLIDAIGDMWSANQASGKAGAASAQGTDVGFFDELKDSVLDTLGIDEDTLKSIEKIGRPIAKIVSGGELTASDIAGALKPLATQISDDEDVRVFIGHTIDGVANAIDTGKLDAETLFDKMLPAFMAAFMKPAEPDRQEQQPAAA